jgi:hypothetical protein
MDPDRPSNVQKQFFPRIEEKLRCEVKVVKLKAQKMRESNTEELGSVIGRRKCCLILKSDGLSAPMFFNSCEGFLQIHFFFARVAKGDPQAIYLLRGKERHSPLYRQFQKSLALKLG